MAAWIRNDMWKCDEELKRDLEGYVKQALKRDEVLDFVSKKYLMYAWRGGHWGLLNTALPQKNSTNTAIPQKKSENTAIL